MPETAPLRAAARAVAALLLVLAAPSGGAAARLELVAGGLEQPVWLTAPPEDERLFVVERTGRIRVIEDGVLLEAPFLDLRDRTDVEREGGLTGLVFPPDYRSTGRFLVYYQHGVPGDGAMQSRISWFAAIGDPATSNRADPDSEAVLYALDQPHTIHQGGTIAIRDGWLYLGMGDGGGGGDGAYDPDDEAQRPDRPFGKMLRFDLAAPAPAPQVWALGFRNPYRFSFDRLTGDLYVGDVGQDRREEIDVEPADAPGGRNYGWDVEEGTLCADPDPGEPPCGSPALVPPVHEYDHEGGCGGSVIGGFVYRGSRVPALRGHYLFADYCRDRIWSLRWDRTRGRIGPVRDRTDELIPETGPLRAIAGFGEDTAGELYVTAMGDFSATGGAVYRLPEPAWGGAVAAAFALAALDRRGRRPAPGGREPG